ncbi:MAG: ribbon-helix-helix protein, CopG family [Thermoleophilaceae bacterium]|nr:ribbon-helix-helix protein, CopG family [Thermoleophilaceae bacterium]
MGSRTQTLVQLTDELRDQLDRRAARLGVSRSRLIRELLERGLTDERAEGHSKRIAEGYARFPQADARDAWGDLDAWSEANARRNLGALAEEEAT